MLADESPMAYGKGKIQLETKPVQVNVAGIESLMSINIMELGDNIEMFLGHDWLRDHNPIIDWQK